MERKRMIKGHLVVSMSDSLPRKKRYVTSINVDGSVSWRDEEVDAIIINRKEAERIIELFDGNDDDPDENIWMETVLDRM